MEFSIHLVFLFVRTTSGSGPRILPEQYITSALRFCAVYSLFAVAPIVCGVFVVFGPSFVMQYLVFFLVLQ